MMPEFFIRLLDFLLGTILFLSMCSSYRSFLHKEPEKYHWKEMK